MRSGVIKALLMLLPFAGNAQSSEDNTKLVITQTLLDAPLNFSEGKYSLTMQQSMELGNNFYELSYRGIDALGNWIIDPGKGGKKIRRVLNRGVKYAIAFPFVKYGSELPIPLGTWTHEEFHRAALQAGGVSSKNGNWIFNRWDGTVYGVSDQDLTALKIAHPERLLRAYTAGVESHNVLSYTNTIRDFYTGRTQYKNELYLNNAHYVFNYFKISASSVADSAKKYGTMHESADPLQRDFAGLDLTAWVYDMFNPEKLFTERDSFPGGEGVNRRIGWSDLGREEQDYLQKQRGLSLLNFVNPGILFLNRIKLGKNFQANAFLQYYPTPFGNSIDVNLLTKFKQHNIYFTYHHYSNLSHNMPGIDIGFYRGTKHMAKGKDMYLSVQISAWMQPDKQSFFAESGKPGGAITLRPQIELGEKKAVSIFADIMGKTEGWQAGNPFLDQNISGRVGLEWVLKKQ